MTKACNLFGVRTCNAGKTINFFAENIEDKHLEFMSLGKLNGRDASYIKYNGAESENIGNIALLRSVGNNESANPTSERENGLSRSSRPDYISQA